MAFSQSHLCNQVHRPDTEVGPLPTVARLLLATRHYRPYLKDEETEEQRKDLGAPVKPEKTASGQLIWSVRERKGADSLPHPPHSPTTPEKDAASVLIVPRSLQTHHHEARQRVPCATPIHRE